MATTATVFAYAPADAGSYTVNTTADTPDVTPGDSTCADAGGSCSLRAAVMEANARPGNDEITVPAGTFTLGLAGDDDSAAAGDIDVAPSDGAPVTITGAGAGSTAIIGNGADRVFHVVNGSAAISSLSIRNGVKSGGNGGGILVAGSGSLALRDLELRGNSAADGAALRSDGSATLARVLVAGNSGAAALATGGSITVINTTISGNSGPGVRSGGGTVSLTHATITGNGGSGVTLAGGSGSLRNSIVFGNSGDECAGFVVSQGHNVFEDLSCPQDGATDRAETDPHLQPLASNGGQTPTHALGTGSVAIDVVADGACPVNEDQRGATRPQNGDGVGGALCDAGAFEAGVGPAAPAPAPGATTTTTRPGGVPPAEPRPGQPSTAG
ncbi:MAG: CSLREA domain-containing protein [Actinobacteria bacterium]|nr:CSLREA domain-containing protein [Actinomycetota bacterium]